MTWKTRCGVSAIFAVLACATASASPVRDQQQAEPLAEPTAEVPAEQPPTAESEPGDAGARGQLQRMYVEYLTTQGYRPRLDDDGDVEFEHDELYVYILVDETDPEFFSMIIPNVWDIGSEEERELARAGADAANARAKVAKVYTVQDTVWVSFEVFVARPEDFKPFFARALRAMTTALDGFLEHMPPPGQEEVGARRRPSVPNGYSAPRRRLAIRPPPPRRSALPAAWRAAPVSPDSA